MKRNNQLKQNIMEPKKDQPTTKTQSCKAGVGGSYFTITTSPKTAEKIRKQCEFNQKFDVHASYFLGKIETFKGLVGEYSIVQIVAKDVEIKPSDIFFLGLFAAGQ